MINSFTFTRALWLQSTEAAVPLVGTVIGSTVALVKVPCTDPAVKSRVISPVLLQSVQVLFMHVGPQYPAAKQAHGTVVICLDMHVHVAIREHENEPRHENTDRSSGFPTRPRRYKTFFMLNSAEHEFKILINTEIAKINNNFRF